jgi:hypothetical protein
MLAPSPQGRGRQFTSIVLEEVERLVFQRLAIFVGGWSLDAAEAICGSSRQGGTTALILERRKSKDGWA